MAVRHWHRAKRTYFLVLCKVFLVFTLRGTSRIFLLYGFSEVQLFYSWTFLVINFLVRTFIVIAFLVRTFLDGTFLVGSLHI